MVDRVRQLPIRHVGLTIMSYAILSKNIETGETTLTPAPPPTVDDVRAECQRRMMALVGARSPEHLDLIISNGTREAVKLLRKGAANWSPEEATRAAQLEGFDEAIDHLRACSNLMEADPPANFREDSLWA